MAFCSRLWTRKTIMRRILLPILGVYAYLMFFFLMVAFLPVVAIASLLHKKDPIKRVPGRWVRNLGRACGSAMPLWRFTIHGAPPKEIDERPFVVISNHESSADPFLLARMPWDMRWVAKMELFRIPLTGWILRLGGEIPIERGKRESVEAMYAMCEETIRHGHSVMLFPEGTRSPDGRLLPFRDGAFEMALRSHVPILPIAVAGTKDCRPKGSLWFGWAHAHARILPPIPTEGMGMEDLADLRERARALIAKEVLSLREEIGSKRKQDR